MDKEQFDSYTEALRIGLEYGSKVRPVVNGGNLAMISPARLAALEAAERDAVMVREQLAIYHKALCKIGSFRDHLQGALTLHYDMCGWANQALQDAVPSAEGGET